MTRAPLPAWRRSYAPPPPRRKAERSRTRPSHAREARGPAFPALRRRRSRTEEDPMLLSGMIALGLVTFAGLVAFIGFCDRV